MKNEIQNNDILLPGGIGTIKIGNDEVEIIQLFKAKDGSITLTCIYAEGFAMETKTFPEYSEPKQIEL